MTFSLFSSPSFPSSTSTLSLIFSFVSGAGISSFTSSVSASAGTSTIFSSVMVSIVSPFSFVVISTLVLRIMLHALVFTDKNVVEVKKQNNYNIFCGLGLWLFFLNYLL